MNVNIMPLAGDLVLSLSAIDLRQAANAFLCVAGPFFFIGMQASSLQTAMKIARNSSIAVVVGCICVSIFHKNAKEGISLYLYLCSCFIVIPSVFLGASGDILTLGLIGVFLSILLTGSPLSTVSTVLKERSTESMPFATSLAAFLNCLSWTLYGYYVADDLILWVSSAIGLLFAIFQLVLFIIFGISSRSREDVSQLEIINIQATDQLVPRNVLIQSKLTKKENIYKPILRDDDTKINYSGEQLP